MDIKLLQKQGHSIRSIAQLTGPQPFHKPKRKSLLDDFKSYIEKRFQECALSPVRLLEEIRSQGYTGSVDSIRRFLRTLRPLARAVQKATVRFETPPGFQAQCDWSYCGRFSGPAGNIIPLYCFVMVLSFSRYLFIELTTSMTMPVFIKCHLDAFSYFGGWTETILYDSLKQVRLNRSEFNPLMVDFTSHYGLTLKTHKPRRP
ncbi:MAG: DDE-type integrase/transposase/recombinase [Acidobacteriota bacterium]